MDILSTREVAEMLGISPATVKRWADAGALRCFRTAGGHRKFRLREVRAFLLDQHDGPLERLEAPQPQAGPFEPQRIRELALSGDTDGLVSFLATGPLRGTGLAQTFDRVLTTALVEIGESWSSGAITVAHEHIASNTVIEALARIKPIVERQARVDLGRALCGCIGTESHDIGARMASLVLASLGYKTVFVGSVPASELAIAIEQHKPVLVALSSSPRSDGRALLGDISVVASSCAAVGGTRLIVGGSGFAALTGLPARVKVVRTLTELVREAEQDPAARAVAPDSHVQLAVAN